jgi:lipoprotein-anchoring transpeptidase ErfK/SrfK
MSGIDPLNFSGYPLTNIYLISCEFMSISRRKFVQLAALGVSGLLFDRRQMPTGVSEFPNYDRLGRICAGAAEVKALPSIDSQTIGMVYEDTVLPWLRERAAINKDWNRIIQRWVETPDGYVYSAYIQPVRNLPNQPVDSLTPMSFSNGGWFEVTVPYADAILNSGPSSNSWVSARVEQGLPIRVYYGQVFFVDNMRVDNNGKTYYRVNPNYYGGLDMLWVPAEALRLITPEDISPISPEVENKRVVINLSRQSLSLYEGDVEVFYCRVSTGIETGSTPVGTHRVTRKYISLQMSGSGSGGTGAGYDLPGIGWSSIFVTGGVAVHATVWHNEFGFPRSHGCVNCLPEDAKYIFRWLSPVAAYDPGMTDVSVTGETSTVIEVVDE